MMIFKLDTFYDLQLFIRTYYSFFNFIFQFCVPMTIWGSRGISESNSGKYFDTLPACLVPERFLSLSFSLFLTRLSGSVQSNYSK